MNGSWNRVSASHPDVLQGDLSTLIQQGIEKGVAPKYVFYLWVGWLLQFQTIDGPACQGVLIWDGACQVGYVGQVACKPPVEV